MLTGFGFDLDIGWMMRQIWPNANDHAHLTSVVLSQVEVDQNEPDQS